MSMDPDYRQERNEVARKILAEAPRLGRSDRFAFSCHRDIACFNRCCADVNIVLTPFDILRLSRRLGLATTDFLERHTLIPFTKDQKLPFVFLKMTDPDKKCPFVAADGCQVYSDRPWPCRMYPLGQAQPSDPATQGQEFFFLMAEDHCQGHRESRTWTVEEWLLDQGIPESEEWGALFKEILLHPYLADHFLEPARMEMFYMACYDLDKFRQFVRQTRFQERFRLEPGLMDKLGSDDKELLRFAFRWLRFALFGEMTLELNPEVLSERERSLVENRIKR